jgi:uncharacterized protein
MQDDANRIIALDALRGLAVMGILIANIVAFALPPAYAINPFAGGSPSAADQIAWLLSFLLVDGKMRALFALMFGASMLLVIEAAEMAGRDGRAAHRRRMAWLLPIGLAHYALLWDGDILMLYAVAGLLMLRVAHWEPGSLLKGAFLLVGLQLLIVVADGWLVSRLATLGGDGIAEAVRLHQGGWATIAAARMTYLPLRAVELAFYALPETMAYMAFGMAMLKGGFLAATWPAEQYRRTLRHGYLVGLPPLIALALWVLLSRDPVVARSVTLGWSMPFRVPVTIAHAALAMALILRLERAPWRDRLAAVGRMALSNYVGTSLVMTTLFYGYGLGLYGNLGRAALVLPVLVGWALMLLWSPLWLARFRYGPLEWVWRSLARGRAQPMRRA